MSDAELTGDFDGPMGRAGDMATARHVLGAFEVNHVRLVSAGSEGTFDGLLEPGGRYVALHLFNESGELRGNVLCFCNDVLTRSREDLSVAIRAGDTITILNSVAGG